MPLIEYEHHILRVGSARTMRLAALIAAVAALEERVSSGPSNPMKDSAKGVPLRVGFFTESLPPFYLWDNKTQTRLASGFLRIEEMILDAMGFDYTYVPIGTTAHEVPKVVEAFSNDEIDVVFGQGPLFWEPFHVSEPMYYLENRAMIRKERVSRADVASIFGPFAADLWYAILGAIVFVALILWLLDKILRAPAAKATRDAKGDAGTEGNGKERSYLYLASALILTNDEPGDTSPSPAALLFRVACIFIGVVVSSTCASRAEALDAVSRGHPAAGTRRTWRRS